MSARLPTDVRAGALLRRVNDAGGLAMVLARGDRHDGGILLVIFEKSSFSGFFERESGIDGVARLARVGPAVAADAATIADYWQRRRRIDPDLWVIELDIASAERFAAETLLVD